MKLTCPKCNEELSVECKSHVPDSQVLKLSIEGEGEFLPAEALMGVIRDTNKVMKSIAKDYGAKVTVFIKSIVQKDARIDVEFVIATDKPLDTQ